MIERANERLMNEQNYLKYRERTNEESTIEWTDKQYSQTKAGETNERAE